MKKSTIRLALLASALSIAPARACHLAYHKHPVRDFMREARAGEAVRVVFAGVVVSVKDYRIEDHSRDAALRRKQVRGSRRIE